MRYRWFFVLSLLVARSALAAGVDDLLGSWKCQSEAGVTALEFESADRMRFEGDASSYTLSDKTLQIHAQDGDTDYPYRLVKGVLSIDFPDGSQLVCRRSESGGQNLWSLQGRFCSAAAGNGPSWLVFNGRGGVHSSLDKGGPTAKPGRYAIRGNALSLTYAGGGTVDGTVKARSDDGHVSALELQGRLYAIDLCR